MFVVFFLSLSRWHTEGSQSPGDESRDRIKVSTVRLQGVPLGQRQEGRAWEDLPESERRCCGTGIRDRLRGGWRARAVLQCLLLPASQILQDSVHLFFFAESLKERQQVQQLCVIHVVEPGLDRDSVFWVENVRGR